MSRLIALLLFGLLAVSAPAQADTPPDSLVLEHNSGVIDLLPYMRVIEGQWHFALTNPTARAMLLELDLLERPHWLDWRWREQASRLRLWDSQGQEFVADERSPHRIALNLPANVTTYYVLGTAGVSLTPIALRLWQRLDRYAAEQRLARVRTGVLMILGVLYGIGGGVALLMWSLSGALAWGAGISALLAYWFGLTPPTLALPNSPTTLWGSPATLLFGLLGLSCWVGFHIRMWGYKRHLRLHQILAWVVNICAGSLLLLAIVMTLNPVWYRITVPLYLELLFVSMLLFLGLGVIGLAVMARLPVVRPRPHSVGSGTARKRAIG